MTTPFRENDPVAVLRGDRIWRIDAVEDVRGYVRLAGDTLRRCYDAHTGYEAGVGGNLKHRLRIAPLTPELLALYREQRQIELAAERRERLAALVRTWLLTASAGDAARLEALIGGAP